MLFQNYIKRKFLKDYETRISFFIFLNILKKYKKLILTSVLIIFIEASLILPMPIIIGKVIDSALPNKDFKLLLRYLIILISFNILNSFVQYIKEIKLFKLKNHIVIDLRLVLLKKLSCLTIDVLEGKSTGYLMSRTKDDSTRLASTFVNEFIFIFKHIAILLISLFTILYINIKLAILSIFVTPFILLTVLYFSKIIKQKTEIAYEKVSISDQSLDESISSISLLKSFKRDVLCLLNYHMSLKSAYRNLLDLKKTEALFFALMLFWGSLLTGAIFTYGGYQVINNEMTIGLLVTFLSVLNNFMGPATKLMSLNVHIKKVFVSLERMGEILKNHNLPNLKKVIDKQKAISKIIFSDISFSYDKFQLLYNLNFSTKIGDIVSITGASGAGKSTLGKIIVGLLPFQGKITLNNILINKNNYHLLTSFVSWVPQEPLLLNDSIYKNISLGNNEATEKDIINYLKLSNAWGFVEKLKKGIFTNIGKKGIQLSLGQKQRLCIARAIMKRSQIIVFDEPTSSVDQLSKKLIMKSINNISTEKIIFIITHDNDIIKECNKTIPI